MNQESLIKGRIAEQIVEFLLQANGYEVVRIAQEGLLINLDRRLTKNLNQSDSAGKITTAPSFAIFDKKGKVVIAKVKFKGDKASGRNISHGLQKLQKYWSEAILIMVTNNSPYFFVILNEDTKEDIIKVFSAIKKQSLAEFGGLVKKFLK
jgi:hypothetical protein